MIVIKVSNGLGNQMFQYALGLRLSDKYGWKNVSFDITNLMKCISGRKTHYFYEIFNFGLPLASFKMIRKSSGKVLYYKIPLMWNFIISNEKVYYCFNKITSRICIKNKNYIIEPKEYWNISEDFIDAIINMKFEHDKDYYLEGFWEDLRYFIDYKDQIRSMFSFKRDPSCYNSLYSSIKNSNSVAIHIRRGDYLLQDPKSINFNVCTMDYYKRAIQYIETHVENPTYFLFGDDYEYIMTNFAFIKNKIVVKGNKDYEDMQLMSLCKNCIIANSTFSFWAAFLNKNDGYIIAPKTHYLKNIDSKWEKKDFFYLDSWIRMENVNEIL